MCYGHMRYECKKLAADEEVDLTEKAKLQRQRLGLAARERGHGEACCDYFEFATLLPLIPKIPAPLDNPPVFYWGSDGCEDGAVQRVPPRRRRPWGGVAALPRRLVGAEVGAGSDAR